MFSVHQPLYLRTQTQTTTLSDTDEFWLSPLPQENTTRSTNVSAFATFRGINDIGQDRDDHDVFTTTPSPSSSSSSSAAHHQLLAHDIPSSADLKGYHDIYDKDDEFSSFFRRPTLTEVKHQGGGSWLLGFVGAATTKTSEQREDNNVAPILPGLVRVPSSDSESDSDDDDESIALQSSLSTIDDENDSIQQPKSTPQKRKKGVSFSPKIQIQSIPHVSTLSSTQRRRMYSSSDEVRRNKIRNTKEYRYDGCDWRNLTEESEMDVDDVTGELIHPVHEYEWR
mmetsp:Transcript_851/g.1873  ORF Transcript_851/g.1873 Transcript_851/m.1873 type:complete len:282 (+) Transcript_851:129-974(+)